MRPLFKLSLSEKFLQIFFFYKFVFTDGHKDFFSIFSFSFPPDSTRGCRAKVWYRARNTPARLGFAPEDSQPCEPWCRCSCLFPSGDVASFSYFFSSIHSLSIHFQIHNSITNLLVIKTLLFDLGSTQSQSSDCAGFCPPLPFCQDRMAVGPTA